MFVKYIIRSLLYALIQKKLKIFDQIEIIENIQLKNKAYLRTNYQGLQLKNEILPAFTKYMCSAPPVKKEKVGISVLGKLRKQTGYSLSLCKKALNNCDQDLEKAKQWLEVN